MRNVTEMTELLSIRSKQKLKIAKIRGIQVVSTVRVRTGYMNNVIKLGYFLTDDERRDYLKLRSHPKTIDVALMGPDGSEVEAHGPRAELMVPVFANVLNLAEAIGEALGEAGGDLGPCQGVAFAGPNDGAECTRYQRGAWALRLTSTTPKWGGDGNANA